MSWSEFKPLLKSLWDAWLTHPFCEEYYEDDNSWGPPEGIFEPLCMGVYKHEAGVRGDTSYTVSTLTEVVRMTKRPATSRMLGEFVGVQPIQPWVPLSRPIRFRSAVISNSPLAGGNAYECRLVLRVLLPKKLHPLINRARRYNRWHKTRFLEKVLIHERGYGPDQCVLEMPGMARDRSLQPSGYRGRTKGELFCIYGLTEKEKGWLGVYFEDLMDFWKIATGRVKSVDAWQYINQQLTLPGWEVPL